MQEETNIEKSVSSTKKTIIRVSICNISEIIKKNNKSMCSVDFAQIVWTI